jgi:hypothetical protein
VITAQEFIQHGKAQAIEMMHLSVQQEWRYSAVESPTAAGCCWPDISDPVLLVPGCPNRTVQEQGLLRSLAWIDTKSALVSSQSRTSIGRERVGMLHALCISWPAVFDPEFHPRGVRKGINGSASGLETLSASGIDAAGYKRFS